MRNLTLALMAVCGTAIAANAGTPDTIVAYWNLNRGLASDTQWNGVGFAADAPSASTGTFGVGNVGAPTNVRQFTGTTVNALGGDLAGNDLALQWGTGGANAGAYYTMGFDSGVYESLSLSFAARRTGTGPTGLQLFTSNDGTNFTFSSLISLEGFASGTYGVVGADLPSSLDGDSTAFLRLVPVWPGNATAAGNVRVDNIVISGTLIPTPGSVALLGLGGLVAARRRRA